jgi:cyclophilin family peptidyl-prolyl cis-trans isomerase
MTRSSLVLLSGFSLLLVSAPGSAQVPAKKAPAAAKPAAAPAPPVAPGTEAIIETPKGSFTIRLLPEIAPKHAALFVKTAKAGGYDGTTFHRVIMGGMIQGGDPLTKDPAKASQYGTGGLGLLKAELSDRSFVRGTVAAVLRPSSIDSAGTQFFVCLQPQPALTGKFTVFGEVTAGMEVVDQISTTPVDGEKAKDRVEMKVTVREPAPGPLAHSARSTSSGGRRQTSALPKRPTAIVSATTDATSAASSAPGSANEPLNTKRTSAQLAAVASSSAAPAESAPSTAYSASRMRTSWGRRAPSVRSSAPSRTRW